MMVRRSLSEMIDDEDDDDRTITIMMMMMTVFPLLRSFSITTAYLSDWPSSKCAR